MCGSLLYRPRHRGHAVPAIESRPTLGDPNPPSVSISTPLTVISPNGCRVRRVEQPAPRYWRGRGLRVRQPRFDGASEVEVTGTIRCQATIEYGLWAGVGQSNGNADNGTFFANNDNDQTSNNADAEGVGAYGPNFDPPVGISDDSPCSQSLSSYDVLVQQNRDSGDFEGDDQNDRSAVRGYGGYLGRERRPRSGAVHRRHADPGATTPTSSGFASTQSSGPREARGGRPGTAALSPLDGASLLGTFREPLLDHSGQVVPAYLFGQLRHGEGGEGARPVDFEL